MSGRGAGGAGDGVWPAGAVAGGPPYRRLAGIRDGGSAGGATTTIAG